MPAHIRSHSMYGSVAHNFIYPWLKDSHLKELLSANNAHTECARNLYPKKKKKKKSNYLKLNINDYH